MLDKIIVEVDHRSDRVKEDDINRRDAGIIERLERKALDDRRRAYDQGFFAGIEAAQEQIARGTRDFDDEPTAPYPVLDPDLVVID